MLVQISPGLCEFGVRVRTMFLMLCVRPYMRLLSSASGELDIFICQVSIGELYKAYFPYQLEH